MNARDGITGYVAGGLGNQLFILAATWEQANRLGCPAYIDASHTRVAGTWDLALEGLTHPAIDLGTHSPWTSRRVSKNHVYPMPRNFSAVGNRIFFEKDPAIFDNRINNVRPGTTLVGYFQSEKYFPTIAPEFATALRNTSERPDETEYLAELNADARITLHLRRGDYLASGANAPLVASADYARRAIGLLRDLGLELPLRVFSDSPELVREELSDLGESFDFVDERRLHSGFSTIKAMAAGQAIITSNSSFSWWAAWLMQHERGHDTRIVTPRPWNESGSARADMIGHSWISLDARPESIS